MRYRLTIALLLIAYAATSQSISREKIISGYGNKGVLNIPTLLITRQQQVLAVTTNPVAASSTITQGFYFSNTLFDFQLDTICTHLRLNPVISYSPDGRTRQLPNGGFISLSTLTTVFNQNAPRDFRLQRLGPGGRFNWQRTYDFQQGMDDGLDALPAGSDGGFMLMGWRNNGIGLTHQNLVLRTDSLGNALHERRYKWDISQFFGYAQPVRGGRFLLAGRSDTYLSFLLVSNQGDSLRGAKVVPFTPPRTFRATSVGPNGLLALADGGFLYTSELDSTSRIRLPVVVRLDSLLRLRWHYVHRAQAPLYTSYGQSVELQDGSTLTVCSVVLAPRQPTYWLHHFSAAGQRLGMYPLTGQLCQQVEVNKLVAVPGTRTVFVAGICLDDPLDRRGYLARVELTGPQFQPTVLATAPAAPAAGPAASLEVYPNPASEQAQVRYELPAGTKAGKLLVRDAMGRLVHEQPWRVLAGGSLTLDVGGWVPGFYICTLLAADGRPLANRRLIVAQP